MTLTGGLRQVPPSEMRRLGWIELLFDIVFVFAFTQLSATMFAHLTWAGIAQTLVLVAAFWWVWVFTSWTTNRLEADQPPIQLILIAIMLGASVMGAAALDAYNGTGLIFASTYVVIQLGRTLFVTIFLRGQQVALGNPSLIIWFTLTGALWIVGAMTHGTARIAWWTAAVGLTYVMARTGFRFPGLSTGWTGDMKVSEKHMAERYQQIIIVALGEKVLAAGLNFTEYDFEAPRSTAFVVSFVTTILLWRIYFFKSGSLIAEAIASAPKPAALTRSISYAHLIMFTGIIISSLGEKIIVVYADLDAELLWVVVIVGGPALFLIGRERLDYLSFQTMSRSGLIGIAVLAAITPAMISLPAPLVTTIVNLVLIGVVIADIFAERAHPHTAAPPPLKERHLPFWRRRGGGNQADTDQP